MYIKGKRGQSTVEYVLLVTAVLAVLIAFFANAGGNNGFSNQLNSALNSATGQIGQETEQFAGSHALSPSGAVTPTPYNIDVTNGT